MFGLEHIRKKLDCSCFPKAPPGYGVLKRDSLGRNASISFTWASKKIWKFCCSWIFGSYYTWDFLLVSSYSKSFSKIFLFLSCFSPYQVFLLFKSHLFSGYCFSSSLPLVSLLSHNLILLHLFNSVLLILLSLMPIFFSQEFIVFSTSSVQFVETFCGECTGDWTPGCLNTEPYPLPFLLFY